MSAEMGLVLVVSQVAISVIFWLLVENVGLKETVEHYQKQSEQFFEETRELRQTLFIRERQLAKRNVPEVVPEVVPIAIPTIRRQWHPQRNGYVYVIQDIDATGHYKIGRTSDTARRFGDFAAKWPFRWEVVHTIETADCIALETELHRQYADKRVRGEWFALDDDDIAAIRRLA